MVRITGGTFRGRSIQTPPHQKTRPTQARLRQALFNSLQTAVGEAKVLDLFAGSGALGFEALSRGAQQVVFVEQSKSVLKLISQNARLLKVEDQIKILGEDVERVIPRLALLAPFDLILADPPYEEGWEMKLLENFPWKELLVPGGFFCLEWGVQKSLVKELPESVPFLVKVREKNYGDSVLTTYQREE